MGSVGKVLFLTYKSMSFLLRDNYVMIILTYFYGTHFLLKRMTDCSERGGESIEKEAPKLTIRNERRAITTQLTDIKIIIRE